MQMKKDLFLYIWYRSLLTYKYNNANYKQLFVQEGPVVLANQVWKICMCVKLEVQVLCIFLFIIIGFRIPATAIKKTKKTCTTLQK